MKNTFTVGRDTYKLVEVDDPSCAGCAATQGDDLCKDLGPCSDIRTWPFTYCVWERTSTSTATPYDICMAEHYKYLQYDAVDMDDFERGCIVGRKLQSEKLARLLK